MITLIVAHQFGFTSEDGAALETFDFFDWMKVLVQVRSRRSTCRTTWFFVLHLDTVVFAGFQLRVFFAVVIFVLRDEASHRLENVRVIGPDVKLQLLCIAGLVAAEATV